MLAVVDPSLIWLRYITMLTANGMKNNQAGGEKVLDDGEKCFVNI